MTNKKRAFLLLSFFFSLNAVSMQVARLSATLVRHVIDTQRNTDRQIDALLKDAQFEFFLDEERDLLREIALSSHIEPMSAYPKWEEHTPVLRTQNFNGVELQFDTPFQEHLREMLRPGMRVLDVGCAYGYNTRIALELGAHVVALDKNPAHLAVLVRDTPADLLPQLTIELGTFPYHIIDDKEEIYDAIIFGQVLHFLPPWAVKSSYQKSYKFLKDGGLVFVMQNTLNSKLLEKWQRELDARVLLATFIVLTTNFNGMVFPTYLSEVAPSEEIGVPYSHPQDTKLTMYNLSVAGLLDIAHGEFNTGFLSTDGSPIILPADFGDYAFIVAHK